MASYYAEGGGGEADRPVELSMELGIAIEALPPGIMAKALWQIV